jgi:hypothetical protein
MAKATGWALWSTVTNMENTINRKVKPRTIIMRKNHHQHFVCYPLFCMFTNRRRFIVNANENTRVCEITVNIENVLVQLLRQVQNTHLFVLPLLD